MIDQKPLIVYFSRRGQNYVSGKIIDLPVGNTEIIAGQIRAITSGDLFEIETVKAYPLDYTETTNVAKRELKDQARPVLKVSLDSISNYELIYLGYPNWWGTMPMAVFTFLESYDFSGKTIIPFCTHEGSGLGHSVDDLRKLVPNSMIGEGIAISGSRVAEARNDVQKWLSKIVFNK